jgi:signal transduction histidine kinase
VSRSGSEPSDHLALAEAARLVALWRLAAGAAHATNNSLTAILGEASFLRDECKADPEVVACCDAVMAEVDRCARLTRALLSRRQPSQSGDEVDLGRLLGEMRDVLPDTLGRRYGLRVEPGSEHHVVSGRPEELELLVLCLVQAACDLAGEGARLDLVLENGSAEQVTLRLAVEADGLKQDAAERLVDPGTATGGELRTLCLAAQEIADGLGSKLACSGGLGRLDVSVSLRLAP